MEKVKKIMDQYSQITLEIEILILNDNYEKIDGELEKRSKLINSISEKDRLKAIKIYNDMEISKLDERIRHKLELYLDESKEEIKKYRKTKAVNSVYSRNNIEKLNIFSKKV